MMTNWDLVDAIADFEELVSQYRKRYAQLLRMDADADSWKAVVAEANTLEKVIKDIERIIDNNRI